MTPTNNLTRFAIGLGLLFGIFFLSVLNVKAYDFTGINKVSRLDFGLYNDTTIVSDGQINCTSSNDGFCGFESSDLPTTSATYNNLRFVIRGTDGKTFSVGTQYKISWYFSQYTTGYFIAPGTISQVTGNSYQNFSSWTSNDISIVSYSLVPLETSNSLTLYRVDVIFIPTSSTIAGFNFRLYRDSKTLYSSDTSYMEFYRYMSISQIGNSSIDYTQDLNNINQSINDLSEDISSSTQDIINNQNQNTQSIIDSNKSCQLIDRTSIVINDKYLSNSGEVDSIGFGITNYIKIDSSSTITILETLGGSSVLCFYNINKTKISCIANNSLSVGQNLTIPSNASYVRFSISKGSDKPKVKICKNGNQAISDALTDDNIGGSTSSASNFFSSFTTETYGLTSVITSPLTFIQSLTSKTCSPLVLPLPYVNRNLELPCMRGIYEQHFGGFLSLYQTITFGIISYWIVVRIFNLVKDFKNPDHDEIEVMDL